MQRSKECQKFFDAVFTESWGLCLLSLNLGGIVAVLINGMFVWMLPLRMYPSFSEKPKPHGGATWRG